MDLKSRLTEQRDATEAVESRTRRRSLSTIQFQQLREALLSDSYLFAKVICRHKDLIPEVHMPLSYAAAGLTDRLIEVLDAKGFDGFVTRTFRKALWQRGIDWTTPDGWKALDAQLDFQNFRWFRGSFKSSVITHATPTFIATIDPNRTIKITHAVDEKAWAFCDQIGKTIKSGLYRDLFPERIPEKESIDITQQAINFAGRSISHPQKTISACGYKTKEEGAHYDTFFTDDLVNEGNSSPIELKGVHRWLRGVPGMYMQNRRIRRIEVGTKHDEDDDDTFFTTKDRAKIWMTIRVPIEEHDGPITNILQRGKPTVPQMYTPEKVTKLQRQILSDETEVDGIASWRNNYLLDPAAAGGRLFQAHIVDDPDHWWLGPFEYKNNENKSKGRFLVARYVRDVEGNPVAKKEKQIYDSDGNLLENWRDNAAIISFDPWTELDRVCLVDPAWASNQDPDRKASSEPDNWAVSAVGTDYESTSFQLETQSDRTGIEGWIDALYEMDQFYHFRAIGFDGAAYQDAVIKNLMQTDSRLKRLRSRMVKVPAPRMSKISKLRYGLAEPMSMFKFLLRPDSLGNPTREELKMIRCLPSDTDGIADSLSMHRAVNKRTQSSEEMKKAEEMARLAAAEKRRMINPILGVPYAA